MKALLVFARGVSVKPTMRSVSGRLVGFVLCVAGCSAPASQPVVAPCVPCASAAATSVAPTMTPPRSAKLDDLARQRIDRAKALLESLKWMYDKGHVTLSALTGAHRDVAWAARDSGLRGDALRRPLQEYRGALGGLLESTRRRYDSGAVTDADVKQVESAIAEADYWLEEAVERP